MANPRCFLGSVIAAMFSAWAGVSAGDTIYTVNPTLPIGGGNYASIQAAINAIPTGNLVPTTILIASGTYDERVLVAAGKEYVTLKGAGGSRNDVVITAYDWNGGANGWEGSQPLRAYANNFRAENLTLRNTWGDNGQAMALRSSGDKQIYENVVLDGWQDTYLSEGGGRTFFHNSEIRGRVDFIWGSGNVIFDTSTIVSKVTAGNGGYITAANTPASQPYGFTFLNSTLTAASSDGSAVASSTYLGRPWAANNAPSSFASVAYINTAMGNHIRPAGWDNWGNVLSETTSRYSEYGSTGPGGSTAARVAWADLLTPAQAAAYSTTTIFNGWDPLTTPMVPVAWNGGAGDGVWGSAANWNSGTAPRAGQNLSIQPASSVTVSVTGSAVGDSLNLGTTGAPSHLRVGGGARLQLASTLVLDGGSSITIDGGAVAATTVSVPVSGTTNQILIRNGGQLDIGTWTGAWGPAGRLVIASGSFAARGLNGPQILLAPAAGDTAQLLIRPGDSWTKTRYIETGDGTSLITQTGGTVAGTYGPYMGMSGTGGGVATYDFSGGVASWLDPNLGRNRGGTFTVNQTGGTMYAVGATGTQYSYNDGIVQLGTVAGANASWNLGGTAAFNHRGLGVGGAGQGRFVQTAGSVTLDQPLTATTKGQGLRIGFTNGGTGLYEISGGSLMVANGGLAMGYNLLATATVTGTGAFRVVGGGPMISIAGGYRQGAGSTLAAVIRPEGLATIHVIGDVNFAAGSFLDLTADAAAAAGSWVLMDWTGSLTGTPVLSSLTNSNRFRFTLDGSARTLTVSMVPEPGTLAVLVATLAIVAVRHRRTTAEP